MGCFGFVASPVVPLFDFDWLAEGQALQQLCSLLHQHLPLVMLVGDSQQTPKVVADSVEREQETELH